MVNTFYSPAGFEYISGWCRISFQVPIIGEYFLVTARRVLFSKRQSMGGSLPFTYLLP